MAQKARGTRRNLTADEKQDALRAQAIYAEQAKAGKFKNQEALAEACGWTGSGHSTVSQYLGGIIPLNLEAVLKLARAFGVAPSAISPRLAALLPESTISPEVLDVARRVDALPREKRKFILDTTRSTIRVFLADAAGQLRDGDDLANGGDNDDEESAEE